MLYCVVCVVCAAAEAAYVDMLVCFEMPCSVLSCRKLHDMQLQTLTHSYSEQNVRALARISQDQQQMEQELQDALQQVSTEFV